MTIDDKDVIKLYEFIEVEYIEPSKKVFLSAISGLNYSCIPQVKSEDDFGLSGEGIAVGIIDSGIDLSHPEFLNSDKTSRVIYFWDMSGEGTPPDGFVSGVEYTNSEINDALQSGINLDTDNIGHGTAVAGIAAGNSGAAPKASIISVKLTVTRRENYSRTTDVMRAIKYILDKSRSVNMPCVINLSYGTNEGSHNGQSLFETYIDEMTQKWKTVIVCASGNEGFGGHHFFDRLLSRESINVQFTTATFSSTMYMTLWKNFADGTTYELIAPNGESTGIITSVQKTFSRVLYDVRISILYGQPSHYSTAQEVYFYFEAQNGSIPNGIWSLICRGENIVYGYFDIWLPTIEEVTENTAFLRPYADLTMTIPSTSEKVIAAGGYNAESDTSSSFSGRGTEICNNMVKLDIVAPAENIISAKSGGGYDAFTGTSMAAPFVSGSAALMMEWGIVRKNEPFLYGQRVKALLCRNAERDTFLSYPNSIWGYGILRLCNSMNELKKYLQR